MPLSDLQARILRLLSAHRNPESYIAGAIPLTRAGSRYSRDIDVFHDREVALQVALDADVASLLAAGFTVEWTRRLPALSTALIRSGDEGTVLEWLIDSAFRFFPVVKDDLFGFVLHPADIATNKALAAAGRREPRDIVDLLAIHEQYLPLGAIAWAASGKDLGFSPEGILAEIRRNSRYQQADYDRLDLASAVDAAAITRALYAALEAANAFVRAMPAGSEGALFIKDGRLVQPDPSQLGGYTVHFGVERGHWPSSSQIASAMLEHLRKPE